MNKDAYNYVAHAFHPSLGNEAVAGRIVFTQFLFQFESETASVEIPLNELQLRVGEGEDERLFFHHPRQADWTIFTPDYEILGHPVFSSNNHLRGQVQAIFGRRASRKAVITTAVALAVVAVIFSSISWAGSRVVRASVDRIPPESEQKLSNQLLADLEEEVPVSEDPKLIAKLNALYAQLRMGLPDTNMTVDFHIIEMDMPNACSLPGHVLVTRGLFKLLTTQDEMAGVLGHELAHITKKHLFRTILSSEGPAYILRLAFGNSGGAMSAIAAGSQLVLGRSFSRDYEREADDEGWKYLVAANIDPRGLAEALRKLQAYEAEHHAHQTKILMTHPPTDRRIRRLESHWDHLKQKSGFIDLSQPLFEPGA